MFILVFYGCLLFLWYHSNVLSSTSDFVQLSIFLISPAKILLTAISVQNTISFVDSVTEPDVLSNMQEPNTETLRFISEKRFIS